MFDWVTGGGNLAGAYIWFQGHDPFQFRLVNPDRVITQGDTLDIEEAGYYWTSDSLLTLDVTLHSPPGHIDLYTFAPGENVFEYTYESDYLTLSGTDWRTGTAWSTEWSAGFSDYGTYWFESSEEPALDSFWQGAILRLEPDLSFNLTNPVTEGASTVVVVESGTFEGTETTITFVVYSQEPVDLPESFYTFSEDTTETAYSVASLSLFLDLSHGGLDDDATVWKLATFQETEPNDETSQSQTLSSPWYYEIHGNLSSGGVDGQGYYIGDKDYFKVIPSGTDTLSVTLSWATGADMDMYLYDAGLNLVNNQGAGYVNPESFTHLVSGGVTYYMLIVAYSGSGDYLLTVDIP